MRFKLWGFSIGLFTIVVLVTRCSSGHGVAGTISQSGNGMIEGKVVTVSGPVPNAMVRVRSESYLASRGGTSRRKARDVVVDSEGCFLVDSLDTGVYRVEASAGAEGVSVLCTLSTELPRASLDPMPPLRPYGVIIGNLDNVKLGSFPWYVQAGGLERLAVVGDAQNGVFTLPDVPAGVYRIVITPSQPDLLPLEYLGVVVSGGDTVRITIVP